MSVCKPLTLALSDGRVGNDWIEAEVDPEQVPTSFTAPGQQALSAKNSQDGH